MYWERSAKIVLVWPICYTDSFLSRLIFVAFDDCDLVDGRPAPIFRLGGDY